MSKKLDIRESLFNSPKASFEEKTRAEVFRVYVFHEDFDSPRTRLIDERVDHRIREPIRKAVRETLSEIAEKSTELESTYGDGGRGP